MIQKSLTARQLEQVSRLARLSIELSAGLEENRERLRDSLAAADQECSQLTAHLDQQSEQTLGKMEHEYNQQLEAARVRFDARLESLDAELATQMDQLEQQRASSIATAIEDFETTDLRLRDRRVYDAEQLKKQHAEFVSKCDDSQATMDELQHRVANLLGRRGIELPDEEAAPDPLLQDEQTWSSTLLREFERRAEQLEARIQSLASGRANRFLDEGWSILLFVATLLVGAWPAGALTGFAPFAWIVALLSFSSLSTFLTYVVVHRKTAHVLRNMAPSIAQEVMAADQAIRKTRAASRREAKAGLEQLQKQCEDEGRLAAQQRSERVDQASSDFARDSAALTAQHARQQQTFEAEWEQETDTIRTRYRPRFDERRSFFARQRTQTLQETALGRDRAEQQFESERQELQRRWEEAVAQFRQFSDETNLACAPVVGDETAEQLEQWNPPQTPPTAIALGHYQLTLPSQPGNEQSAAFVENLPAMLSFPHDASLLLKSSGDGRNAAIKVLQNATLRLISAFPPGKLRLTIIDPLGLGQNFSAFMHLADYDERLIGNRIWTETPHVNQRLADLTEHMENVIQKYLRNEYSSIQEYNQSAGEVAEPYRVLVIADFPHQFSDEATRRLASIAASGPRCGVYTLMSVDMTTKLPRDAQWEELERNAQVFQWQEGRFVNESEPLAGLPLCFDAPPDSQTITQIVKTVGEKAMDTRRVRVPFASVAPPVDEIWKGDCATELIVPLGRSGATQAMSLRLGHGTSQHVLIAGKTGSGKSTLLHALITNAALAYSPDEIQFYLIDFKKGVEFKAYADHQLPHARVIAIESEREFGVSVLHRLDDELRRRGDRFRNAGVQSLAAYRTRCPDEPMPRLLLIVDEFQEFFVNDDRLAHESSLLLDRLVRQGRAFGMHVVLGSQTLSGAYSLARSTIGQMAIRIALECSGGDAHLILSEDNTAARLLSRPGEAIYNDANGRLEGNHPFQVVWLPDEERNAYLADLCERAKQESCDLEPTIVFEGHAAAELAGNTDLRQLVDQPPATESAGPPCAWLGAAIEIKDPTCMSFRRQGGTNLLVVGQNRDLARGLLGSSLISLTACHARARDNQVMRRARFVVLDGERAEQPSTDFADHLQAYLPAPCTIAGPAGAVNALQPIVDELESRMTAPDQPGESIFLVIHDLARFRDLQPAADEFGLGSFATGEATTPSAQLGKILREGPPLGIHTLVWADCYQTISRWFERQVMRDFGHRVLLQMSAVDSSHLMDAASASQLGAYRALLHDQDRGQCEKFRPYSLPNAEWLQHFCQRLSEQPIETASPDQGATSSTAESLVKAWPNAQ